MSPFHHAGPESRSFDDENVNFHTMISRTDDLSQDRSTGTASSAVFALAVEWFVFGGWGKFSGPRY